MSGNDRAVEVEVDAEARRVGDVETAVSEGGMAAAQHLVVERTVADLVFEYQKRRRDRADVQARHRAHRAGRIVWGERDAFRRQC